MLTSTSLPAASAACRTRATTSGRCAGSNGKVTFKVVATINDGYPGDSHPEDNELVATTTTVRPAQAVGAI